MRNVRYRFIMVIQLKSMPFQLCRGKIKVSRELSKLNIYFCLSSQKTVARKRASILLIYFALSLCLAIFTQWCIKRIWKISIKFDEKMVTDKMKANKHSKYYRVHIYFP